VLRHLLTLFCFKDPSEHIKFEAFNVFKVFVANPEKSPAVIDILQRNKTRLIEYLEGFQPETQDEQFKEEKERVTLEIGKVGLEEASKTGGA
jgi:calcium binding protein 39